jgi:hypothetical protein
MSVTYSWNVNTMDVAPSANNLNNVVKVVHWRLIASDGTNSVDSYGSVSLEEPSQNDFVAFNNLTEQKVISWVESKINVTEVKDNLNTQLAKLANPSIVVKQGPWV